jgi:hypothetical protein
VIAKRIHAGFREHLASGYKTDIMAIQKGVFKFTGTIDGVTYYESKYGALVRKKGGPSSEQVKKHPAFKRVRENGKEFGSCGKATKLLRTTLRPFMKEASDFLVTGRLNKLMFAIKNLDNTSARGERNVATGIKSPQAKDLVNGFDFNEMAPLRRVLKKPYTLNTGTGVITITGLIPQQDLDYPTGATHVRLTGGRARIDFGTGLSELTGSNQAVLPLSDVLTTVVLTPVSLPGASGTDMFFLQILFNQEINGISYPLKNGEHNSMCFIDLV